MAEKRAGQAAADLTDQVGRLVRDEVRLAGREMRRKAEQAGAGAALLTGAAVLALYAGGALLAGLVTLLARVLPAWLAAALTGVVLSCVAAVLGRLGVARLRAAVPLLPEEAMAGLEADVDTVREQVVPPSRSR